MPRWDLDGGYSRPKRLSLRSVRAAARRAGSGGGARGGLAARVRIRSLLPLLLWAAAGLALGGILAFGVTRLRQGPAESELIGWGTVEETASVRALVIRQEQVEVAPISGVLLRYVGEGQRVAAGAAVVQVVNPDARVALASRGRAVEEAWTRFEKESEGQRLTTGREVQELQAKTDGLLTGLQLAAVAADGDGMRQAWLGLGPLWDKLERARRLQAELERERALLLSERAKLTALRQEAEVRLTAAMAGAVSFQVDGLELVLRPDRLDLVDLSLVDSVPAPLAPAGDRVDAGQPLYRVIAGGSVVLAFRLLEPAAEDLLRRGSARLRLGDPPAREVQGRVLSLGPAEAGGYRVVFAQVQASPGDSLLWSNRVLPVQVLLRTAQGPRVPSASLTPDPGSPVPAETGLGLYILENGHPAWTPVTVLASDGQQAVVSGVHVGATLVEGGTRHRFR
ncbi:MAG: HlyD family efflux transporter periplasmic adaptor subunit [Symbiobacteriia bacterium]